MIRHIKILGLLLLWGVVFPLTASAQNNLQEISSKVLDEAGNPIAQAAVSGEEGSLVVFTDQQGIFTIKVASDDALLIEAKWYATQRIAVSEIVADNLIVMQALPFHSTEQDVVNMPFGKFTKRRIVGGVSTLDIDDILQYDNEQSFNGVLNARVPGIFGGTNIRGLGNGLIVVDGIPRPAGSLNLQEIDQISVLKGISARMLYGSQAERGVILVTTKRGKPFKRTMNVTMETGMLDPISYPNYLGAADYMSLYNEALANDGEAPQYSEEQIAQTRSGADRVLYPDESYYNSTYLKDRNAFHKIILESSGGNDKAQYYVNMGWNRINSLLNLGEGANEKNDRINLRGNVDYQLNDWLRMSLDGIALIDVRRGPRYSNYNGNAPNLNDDDFWTLTSTILPNAFPVLIPSGQLEDSGLLPSAVLVDGNKVLGGSSEFNNHNAFGELTRNGFQNVTDRVVQINTGLDFDLKGIAEGLTAKTFLSFDFINSFIRQQQNGYAVYQPSQVIDSTGATSVVFNKIGVDEKTDDQIINNADVFFYRRVGLYGVLDYDRRYNNNNALKVTALAYRDQYDFVGNIQTQKNLHFGLRANYAINDKYIVEATGVYAGSPRFAGSNRFSFSPSLGLGWVLSEESFLKDNSFVNYLKLSGSWGILQTDQGVDDYYLYRTSFVEPAQNFQRIFFYNDEVNSNNALNIVTGNPDIGWVKRQEINLGVEAMLGNHLWVEANYFHSKSYDQITKLTGTYPDILGGEDFIPYENYESYLDQGIEAGLEWRKQRGDFTYSIGANIIYSTPKALIVNESAGLPDYRKREGQATDGYFAYVAEGFFQDQADIDNHAVQTFGQVQPGDIKYKDLNNDGIINQDDQELIGNASARFQYGLNLRLGYKNLELFVQGVGQTGGDSYFTNPYYWVYGDRKYSTEVLNRWTPATAATATYPRLSSNFNSNNFRNSTFWLYEDNWFNLRRIQLNYTLPFALRGIKNVRVYARAANVLTISEIKEKRELNIGSAPQVRTYAFGLMAAF